MNGATGAAAEAPVPAGPSAETVDPFVRKVAGYFPAAGFSRTGSLTVAEVEQVRAAYRPGWTKHDAASVACRIHEQRAASQPKPARPIPPAAPDDGMEYPHGDRDVDGDVITFERRDLDPIY